VVRRHCRCLGRRGFALGICWGRTKKCRQPRCVRCASDTRVEIHHVIGATMAPSALGSLRRRRCRRYGCVWNAGRTATRYSRLMAHIFEASAPNSPANSTRFLRAHVSASVEAPSAMAHQHHAGRFQSTFFDPPIPHPVPVAAIPCRECLRKAHARPRRPCAATLPQAPPQHFNSIQKRQSRPIAAIHSSPLSTIGPGTRSRSPVIAPITTGADHSACAPISLTRGPAFASPTDPTDRRSRPCNTIRSRRHVEQLCMSDRRSPPSPWQSVL